MTSARNIRVFVIVDAVRWDAMRLPTAPVARSAAATAMRAELNLLMAFLIEIEPQRARPPLGIGTRPGRPAAGGDTRKRPWSRTKSTTSDRFGEPD